MEAPSRYLGAAAGEHLGYLLTGAWTTLTGVALSQSAVAPTWVGVPGIVVGPILALCSLSWSAVTTRADGRSPSG